MKWYIIQKKGYSGMLRQTAEGRRGVNMMKSEKRVKRIRNKKDAENISIHEL
jgi:hypothetical protein